MGVGLETIFDLADNDENVSLTDLEKWKMFLDRMNIEYKENNKILEIDHSAIETRPEGFGESLEIIFDQSGKFKYFSPWGEKLWN